MSYVDRRISDAEHVLCDDVQQFTSGLADLTGELTAAAIEALFYGTALRIHRGTHGYLAAIAAYIFSAGTLTAALAPNFSRLVSKTQELESRYKASQARPVPPCPTLLQVAACCTPTVVCGPSQHRACATHAGGPSVRQKCGGRRGRCRVTAGAVALLRQAASLEMMPCFGKPSHTTVARRIGRVTLTTHHAGHTAPNQEEQAVI